MKRGAEPGGGARTGARGRGDKPLGVRGERQCCSRGTCDHLRSTSKKQKTDKSEKYYICAYFRVDCLKTKPGKTSEGARIRIVLEEEEDLFSQIC